MEHEHIERQQDQRAGAKGDPMMPRDGQMLRLARLDGAICYFRYFGKK